MRASIPLTSFEKPAQPSRMKIGIRDGVGCAPEGLPAEKRNLTIVPDDFQREQAICFNVKGKGLVIMTSCEHCGIFNSVRGAIKVSGISKVHAIIGGFHLMPMPTEYVRSTVAALKEINPYYLHPDALHGDDVLRGDETGTAGAGTAQFDGDEVYVWGG